MPELITALHLLWLIHVLQAAKLSATFITRSKEQTTELNARRVLTKKICRDRMEKDESKIQSFIIVVEYILLNK